MDHDAQMLDWMRHSLLLSRQGAEDKMTSPQNREQDAWLARKKEAVLKKLAQGDVLAWDEALVAEYLKVYAAEHINDTVQEGRILEARREMVRRL